MSKKEEGGGESFFPLRMPKSKSNQGCQREPTRHEQDLGLGITSCGIGNHWTGERGCRCKHSAAAMETKFLGLICFKDMV